MATYKEIQASRIGNPNRRRRPRVVKPGWMLNGALVALSTGILGDRFAGAAIPAWKKRPGVEHALALGGAALIGAGVGAGLSALHGTGYNYGAYNIPDDGRPVVIAFSGGNGGDWQKYNPDKEALDRQFGKGNYALFGYDDEDVARAYLHALPKGTKIRILGHSLGGPSAYALAEYASDMGIPVDRLDTEDAVGKHMGMSMGNGKPPLVKQWYNWYPKKRNIRNKRGSDYVAVLGGVFNAVDGANNMPVEGEYATHKSVRFAVPGAHGVRNMPEEFKRFAGIPQKQEAQHERKE